MPRGIRRAGYLLNDPWHKKGGPVEQALPGGQGCRRSVNVVAPLVFLLLVGVASLIHVRLVDIVRVVVCPIGEYGAGRCHADDSGKRRRSNDGFDASHVRNKFTQCLAPFVDVDERN